MKEPPQPHICVVQKVRLSVSMCFTKASQSMKIFGSDIKIMSHSSPGCMANTSAPDSYHPEIMPALWLRHTIVAI